jgi:hypothetical protein
MQLTGIGDSLKFKWNYSKNVLSKWKEIGTHPGIPRTPSASDSGSPEKSGMMYGFDNHRIVDALSMLIILLVCHPK